jgi:uncharacterized protein (DUF305 family)
VSGCNPSPLRGLTLAPWLALALVVSAGACAPTATSRSAGPADAESRAAAAAATEHAAHEHLADGHASQAHASHDLRATAGAGYTAADVRFMQMMIGHHEQALRMTALASGRTASPRLLQLVQKIDISQHDEIAQMRAWLAARDQGVPDAGHAHDMSMPGMVTERQFAELSSVRDHAFDRLFLELMIHHHAGAVEMVDELFASPGAGQDPDIFRFATDVAADQLDEIGVMQILLQQIPAQGDQ